MIARFADQNNAARTAVSVLYVCILVVSTHEFAIAEDATGKATHEPFMSKHSQGLFVSSTKEESSTKSLVPWSDSARNTRQPDEEVAKGILVIPEGSGGRTRPVTFSKTALDYRSIAQTIVQDCAKPQSDQTLPKPKIILHRTPYFIITGKAEWLPPKPSNADDDILGVDADGDCVRDDIEHLIANRFPSRDQHRLRQYLYEYAAWMGKFLQKNIEQDPARTIVLHQSEAAGCVYDIMNDDVLARETLSLLFADFHNTYPRSFRNIDNLSIIGGWVTLDIFETSCP